MRSCSVTRGAPVFLFLFMKLSSWIRQWTIKTFFVCVIFLLDRSVCSVYFLKFVPAGRTFIRPTTLRWRLVWISVFPSSFVFSSYNFGQFPGSQGLFDSTLGFPTNSSSDVFSWGGALSECLFTTNKDWNEVAVWLWKVLSAHIYCSFMNKTISVIIHNQALPKLQFGLVAR